MNDERLRRRVAALEQGVRSMQARIAELPDDPRAPRWKARHDEYVRSLLNIRDRGEETVAVRAAPEVEISVPLVTFSTET